MLPTVEVVAGIEVEVATSSSDNESDVTDGVGTSETNSS